MAGKIKRAQDPKPPRGLGHRGCVWSAGGAGKSAESGAAKVNVCLGKWLIRPAPQAPNIKVSRTKFIVVSRLLRAAVNDSRRFLNVIFARRLNMRPQCIVADANILHRGGRYRNGQDGVVEHVKTCFLKSTSKNTPACFGNVQETAVLSRTSV